MKNTKLSARSRPGRALVLAAFTSLTLLLGGCVADPFYYGPPPLIRFHPDPWDYYFYPSAGVYFQFSTGLYFYLQDGVWISATVLPPFIHLYPHERVHLRIESDKPYYRYPDHQRQYPAKPPVRRDERENIREREANTRWYKEYKEKQNREDRRPPGRDRDRYR